MALRNQSLGAMGGVNNRSYGTAPNMVFNTRRPTTKDVFNFVLGTWWIIPKKKSGAAASDPSREVWVLVGNAQHTADWKQLHGGSGPSGLSRVVTQIFTTTGAGTYTPSLGMIDCIVECVGGGGGAGGSTAAGTGVARSSAGGGGGGYCRKLFTATDIGTSQALFIGSGGAGGVGSADGVDGTNTTFGTVVIMTASGGVKSLLGQSRVRAGGVGGAATGGDINIPGQPGGSMTVYDNSVVSEGLGGVGASGMYGSGGASVTGTSNGNPGQGYGSGGGGAVSASLAGPNTGGAGAHGIIIITEYLG